MTPDAAADAESATAFEAQLCAALGVTLLLLSLANWAIWRRSQRLLSEIQLRPENFKLGSEASVISHVMQGVDVSVAAVQAEADRAADTMPELGEAAAQADRLNLSTSLYRGAAASAAGGPPPADEAQRGSEEDEAAGDDQAADGDGAQQPQHQGSGLRSRRGLGELSVSATKGSAESEVEAEVSTRPKNERHALRSSFYDVT